MSTFSNVRHLRIILFSVLTAALMTDCSKPESKPAAAAEETSSQDEEDRAGLARDVQDEITLGREIAAKLLGHFGRFDKDPVATEYVNLVGQTLARQSGRPELEFKFAILDDPGVNAFATPGGYVFITKGTLRSIQDESELAAILGHEIAHINEKHMYNEIMPKKSVSASETVARMLSRGRSDLGSSISKIVSNGLKMLIENGMGQEKEQSADQAGSLYAAAAGYNPRALDGFLKRLQNSPERSMGKASKTHPPFPERIKKLETFLNANGLENKAKANQDILNERFQKYLTALKSDTAKH